MSLTPPKKFDLRCETSTCAPHRLQHHTARMVRIAAVVVTHDRPELLQRVINALHAQARPCDRIFIVDNASGTVTQALLEPLTGLTVLRSDINLGGTGGFTLGLKRACAEDYDWIWLLDDDAIPRLDALAELENALCHVPGRIGAVCGTVREFGQVATMHRRMFTPLLGREATVSTTDYAEPMVAIDTGSFVGFMVKATAVASVGLPDPAFFLAYDDTEYSLRLKHAGFGIWLIPSCIVDHMRTATGRLRSTEFGPKHYFNIRNRIVVKKRYARLPGLAGMSAWLFGLGLWLRSPGRFQRHSWRILARAVSDGHHGRLGRYPRALEVDIPMIATISPAQS